MAVVLSPLLIMGAMNAWSEQQFSQRIRFHELQQTAQDRFRQVDTILVRTRTALRMITAESADFSCSEITHRMAVLDLPLRNTVRFDADGIVTCSEIGEGVVGTPMSQLEWNDRMRKGVEAIETSGPRSRVLGDPSIFMLRRLNDPQGNFAGSIGLSMSLVDIAARLAEATESSSATIALVVPGGEVIGSNIMAGVPMEWISEGASLNRRIHHLTPDQGPAMDIVLLPLRTEGLWLMVASPSPPQRVEGTLAFLVPILAYLAALLAASWIADAMVLRWLERIRIRIQDMRSSARYMPLTPELSRAPREMQQVAEAFDDLTSRITTHESDMQRALVQMKAAFREVHHRVKNNLQVMLSMLKLQGRGEPLPETQAALKVAAHRVAMMAAVHHTLLNEGNLDTVEALDLFNAICNQVDEQKGWVEGGRSIIPDVSPGPLPADMAVPLGMFVLEAVGLLCPDDDDADVVLHFDRDNGNCRLKLTCGRDGTGGEGEIDRDTSLFLSAFARQIGGSVSVENGSETEITIELAFFVSHMAPTELPN
ncbi:sensor histidine kinase [Hyphomonas polymorpha]|nr:sensor histidine kinase [Hyphomonas polymorpha]